MDAWRTIVCVDWAKSRARRRAWIADVDGRRLVPAPALTSLPGLLSHAGSLTGRTLIGIDAALGVPRRYLDRGRASLVAWQSLASFPSWLEYVMRSPEFCLEVGSASEWRFDRPFIRVGAGKGSLTRFWQAAGAPLKRAVDLATSASSPFVVAGIPGTVGSGTRELWREIAPLLAARRDFALWPFDGPLDALRGRTIVVAEVYPRACYALALAPSLPAAPRRIAKTRRAARDAALDALCAARWLITHGVRIDDVQRARASEDDFDALLSAAGLLRCVLEGSPLDSGPCDVVEGGMLGLGSITLARQP